jgi:ketosteroid isomerase-like protein
MSDHEAVLFANEAFYAAFRGRDVEAMVEVWASAAPLTCIHPGWDALDGRDAVIESWEGILGGGNAPDIQCHAARAHIYGVVATVICFEEIDDDYLIATNVFVREDGRWKMVHHQAAPTSGAPPPETETPPPSVN